MIVLPYLRTGDSALDSLVCALDCGLAQHSTARAHTTDGVAVRFTVYGAVSLSSHPLALPLPSSSSKCCAHSRGRALGCEPRSGIYHLVRTLYPSSLAACHRPQAMLVAWSATLLSCRRPLPPRRSDMTRSARLRVSRACHHFARRQHTGRVALVVRCA